MTLGAITLGTLEGDKPSAPLFAIDVSFEGDDAYPTGGTPNFQDAIRDAIEAANAAKSDHNVRGRMDISIQCVAGFESGQYVPYYDAANDKLKVLDGGSATWAEVADTTDIHTTVFNLTLLCY